LVQFKSIIIEHWKEQFFGNYGLQHTYIVPVPRLEPTTGTCDKLAITWFASAKEKSTILLSQITSLSERYYWRPLTLASHPGPSPKNRGGACVRGTLTYTLGLLVMSFYYIITTMHWSIRSWWIILNAHNFILDALWQLGDKMLAGNSFFRIEYWILDIDSWFNFQFVLDIEYEARNQFLICWWKLKATWTKHTMLCDYSIFNIIWISEMKEWEFKIKYIEGHHHQITIS